MKGSDDATAAAHQMNFYSYYTSTTCRKPCMHSRSITMSGDKIAFFMIKMLPAGKLG
jgi:hypothetical protein